MQEQSKFNYIAFAHYCGNSIAYTLYIHLSSIKPYGNIQNKEFILPL